MSSQSIQLRRMSRAIEALRRRPMRAVQLADELGCSPSSALRILDAIRDADLPWAHIKEEKRREPRGRSFERYYFIST